MISRVPASSLRSVRRLVRGGIPACGDSIARMAELYVWDGKFVGNRIAAVAERGARYRRLDFIQLRIDLGAVEKLIVAFEKQHLSFGGEHT